MVYGKRRVKKLYKDLVFIKKHNLKADWEKKTTLIIPDTVQPAFIEVDEGTVVKVSDDVTNVQPGDHVVYSKFSNVNVGERYGEGLVAVRSCDINWAFDFIDENGTIIDPLSEENSTEVSL